MFANRQRRLIGGIMLLSAFHSFQLCGQFSGGTGDGSDHSGTGQSGLYGQIANIQPLYYGGDGDGFEKESFQGVLDGTNLSGLFTGGPGDGFDKNTFQGVLDGTALDPLFAGGLGDGFEKESFQGVLDGTQLAGLFSGGSGDGFQKDIVSTILDGTLLDQLYSGGMGDGFHKKGYLGVVDGTSLATVYSGGFGDGFSKRSQQYIFTFPGCTFVVNTKDNGFGSLRYAVECAQPGDTINFSPALLNNTISLNTAPVTIDKNLSLLENDDLNIKIDASVIERAFALQTGSEVLIKGLKIIVGAAVDGSGLQNDGLLTLMDIQFLNSGSSQSVIENSGSGTITIKGSVEILQ